LIQQEQISAVSGGIRFWGSEELSEWNTEGVFNLFWTMHGINNTGYRMLVAGK